MTIRGSGRLLDRDLLLQAARIVERQIHGWEERQEASEVPEAASAAVDLYGESPGLALFWAAMARSFPEERARYAERSLAKLRATRHRISEWLVEPTRMDAAGTRLGVCGLGGALYALTCAGVLLREEDLLREACAASVLFTPERISRDRRFDFVDGCAGAILALLALDRSLELQGRAHEGLLEAAIRCARHLLGAQSGAPGEPRGWEVDGGRLFCGFAHGAAGILHALLGVYERTGDPACLQAARDAMAFEDGLYRPGIGNWVPYSISGEEGWPTVAWCWGAPGIALGRIASLEVFDHPEVREDIRRGLETTLAQPQTLEDHVCCGNLGRAQILAYSARALAGTSVMPDPGALLTAADRLVHGVLRRAKGRGGFRLSASPDEPFQPFFFKGAAGIGYAFLDLAEPGRLPLPLLLEAPVEREDFSAN